MAELRKTDV